MSDAARWLGAALALASRGVGRTSPNPSVGCIVVAGTRIVGRGWTQPGGRPHAEAMALAQAGDAARGATAYVTLEPCAHVSPRGPACADLLVAAGVGRVVACGPDPDPRTAGAGFARLQAAGIEVVDGIRRAEAERLNAGFFVRQRLGRPHVTLKLALSLDGSIALADGTQPLDHRRAGTRPRPSRAGAGRLDRRRRRHAARRRSGARRAARRAGRAGAPARSAQPFARRAAARGADRRRPACSAIFPNSTPTPAS